MAQAGPTHTTHPWMDIKEAWLAGKMTPAVHQFDMGVMCAYLMEQQSDFRSIRESSYQMFYRGHVKDIAVRDDSIARKGLVRADCLPEMKQGTYKVVLVLKYDGTVDQASCGCAAGKGPRASCKHIAALCYAIEDFTRTFIKSEDEDSCTDKVQKWNKPRKSKLSPAATYEIHFEKQKHGKIVKELVGKHPSFYELDTVCESDSKAAKTLCEDLSAYEKETGKKVGLLCVLDKNAPIQETIVDKPSVETYLESVGQKIKAINNTDSADTKVMKAMDAMMADSVIRNKIEEETREQKNTTSWFHMRRFRITASTCHCVVTLKNLSKCKTALKQTCDPSRFSTAATRFGQEHESAALERYQEERRTKGEQIGVSKCGFVLDQGKGYMGATPDGVVTLSNGVKGIVEVKCPPTFKDMTVQQSIGDRRYPLAYESSTVQGRLRISPKLNHNNGYWHQVQMQLYCCRDFATFCDFVIFHVDTRAIHTERILSDQTWVTTNIPKFVEFYKLNVAPKLLDI